MPLAAVIFDMDETLTFGFDPVNDEEVDIHFLSWQAVLKPFNATIAFDDYCRHMRGATNEACEQWLVSQHSQIQVNGLSNDKETHYRDTMAGKYLHYRPGVQDALSHLQSTKVPLGLLTNAPTKNVECAHEALNLWQYINPALALDTDKLHDMGLAAKPAPDGLLAIARQLDVDVSATAYIGDSLGDMRCAAAAGATGIGLVTTNDATALSKAGARYTIEHFDALPKILSAIAERIA